MNKNTEPKAIKQPLIINSPFHKPTKHWKFNSSTCEFETKPGRRPAGYVVAKPKSYEYGGEREIELVNRIRNRLEDWQKAGRPGLTGVSRHLLEFWHQSTEHSGRKYNLFFCQLEAIETLMFLTEARSDFKQGLHIPKDVNLSRVCCKMATGTGKTVVMAMCIVWQVLNKVLNPKDAKFSKNILIVAPNLTVLGRLKQALESPKNNYYEDYMIVPTEWRDKFRQKWVKIINWHKLQWDSEEKLAKNKGVEQKGVKSDTAYVRELLGEMANHKNIVIINDEAHHAWRKLEEQQIKASDDLSKKEIEKATKWIQGLDRINKVCGINKVFDFSATPYAPTGNKKGDVPVFDWIVSDFGLMDAIEAGLVKTPKFAVGDDASIDAKNLKPRLYHIYEDDEVHYSFQKSTDSNEALPTLVKAAYKHLSLSWQKKYHQWKEQPGLKEEHFVPPVMISVANTKNTADRIEGGLGKNDIILPKEFQQTSKTLKVYSGIDDQMDILSKVGQQGSDGQHIQHVISVMMLSEGWNCQTVTHIMGLRAFSSQLLCEQTVGRGLRRTSYELNDKGLFDPEYVYVLGVPFAYLPQQEDGDQKPVEETPKRRVFIDPNKAAYKIEWPNVERIDQQLEPVLSVDWKQVKPHTLDVSKIPRLQEWASIVQGKTYQNIEATSLQKLLDDEFGNSPKRMQKIIFTVSSRVYDKMPRTWMNQILKHEALRQIFIIVEQFINKGKLIIKPAYEKKRKDLVLMLAMSEVVGHILHLIKFKKPLKKTSVIYNQDKKFSSTQDMPAWWTKKQADEFKKTHTNLCVVDSTWEAKHAYELDKNPHVTAWVKNDHLGFYIGYIDERGHQRKYIPDFIVKLSNGVNLILEVKGLQKLRDNFKWDFMKDWCQAVSHDLGVRWEFRVSKDSTGGHVRSIVDELMQQN